MDEDATGFGEQGLGVGEVAVEVVEVGVEAVLVGVAEGLDDGWVGGEGCFVGWGVAVVGGGLEVGFEADAVGRVHVDHLDFALHALFGEEGGHDADGVAADEAVGPVALVLIPLIGGVGGEVVEVAEEGCGFERAELFDEGGGVDFFGDVEGRGVGGEVVEVVGAVPAEQGSAAAAEGRFVGDGLFVGVVHEGLGLVGGQVGAGVAVSVAVDVRHGGTP